MKLNIIKVGVIILTLIFVASCTAKNINSNEAKACEQGLSAAYKELKFAKVKGFSGTVEWTKASSLLSAAKIQQQFEKYPNCIIKVNRARQYIEQSQKES